jgi:alanine racemase
VTAPVPAPRIHVDLDAIAHNLRAFADAVGVPVIAIVKANAYGHGMLEVGRAAVAAGAAALGVADVDEALQLRAGGITAPVIAWLDAPSIDFGAAVLAGVELGLSSPQHLAMLASWAERSGRMDEPVPVHIKVDTGLGRNGTREADWRPMFALARDYEQRGLVRVRGLMSHFSGTSDDDDRAQLAAFERALGAARAAGLKPTVRHLAATAGALRLPEARYDATRLGIALYGLDPLAPGAHCGIELRPALTLTAHVRRRDVDEMPRWLLDVGQVDGLLPVAEGELTLHDEAGDAWRLERVDATHCIVTPLGDVERSEVRRVTVIGGTATADDWAAASGTINYEVTTRLSSRLPREFHGGHASHPAGARRPRAVAPQVASPLPELVIDDAELAARLAELARDGVPLDLTADAYGFGLERMLGLASGLRLELLVRREHDRAALREYGVTARVEPRAGLASRAIYGFGGDAPSPTVLRSELAQIKRVPAGQGVSYGYEWRAPAPTTLGLVAVGYADAIPRSALGRASLVVDGVPAPIVGRVAMDQVVVDLGDRESRPGAPVRLWGWRASDATLADWETWTGLTAEGIVAGLGARVRRRSRVDLEDV